MLIEGIETRALFETGSKVTCMCSAFFRENQGRLNKCATLPVVSLHATGFTGEKSVRIKKQIHAEFTFGNFKAHLNFLIIPKLV